MPDQPPHSQQPSRKLAVYNRTHLVRQLLPKLEEAHSVFFPREILNNDRGGVSPELELKSELQKSRILFPGAARSCKQLDGDR